MRWQELAFLEVFLALLCLCVNTSYGYKGVGWHSVLGLYAIYAAYPLSTYVDEAVLFVPLGLQSNKFWAASFSELRLRSF